MTMPCYITKGNNFELVWIELISCIYHVSKNNHSLFKYNKYSVLKLKHANHIYGSMKRKCRQNSSDH